ncbi:MAG: M48 family metalloprotease [Rickettsiales bacterium]|nr:M48 family metalloprotease [Rickettsiales bacterium]
MLKKFSAFFILLFTSFFWQQSFVIADSKAPSLIRDAETEKFLRDLSRPIFISANLNPNQISIYIVNDSTLNAFVAGGQNVFINSGLIRKYSTPDTLIGVIAHESGHIAAGHLARAQEGSETAQGAMLLSYLLGIGAALGGSPDAAIALIAGGSQTANRLFMKYTRGQEEAADNHAIEYLAKMQYPAAGLINLLEFFESEMIGYQGEIDEYLLSHPVSKKRIDLIKARTLNTKFSDQKINQKLQPQMDQVLAKLEGFMENPEMILEKYKNQNDDLSNYKKLIAFFRKGEVKKALPMLDSLIQKNSTITLKSKYDSSQIGFLYELKGQILFESGQIIDSIIAYNKAIKFLTPQDSAQAKIAFASAILVLPKDDKDLIKLALDKLFEAKKYENENPFLFKQIAVAYAKTGDEAKSMLALAEFNCMIDQKEKCRKYAKEAKEKLDKNAVSELLRADDLLELTAEEKKEKEKEKKKFNF